MTTLTDRQDDRDIAEKTGSKLSYIVVCPDHGASGPFSESEADYQAIVLNREGPGCVYKVLPLFTDETV